MKLRTFAIAVGAALFVTVAGIYAARLTVIAAAEKNLIVLHKKGAETPSTFGANYREFWIDSGGRKLDASLAVAPSSCRDRVAVLLFHGRGETISDWAKAQAFLSKQCVSSVVFDYSGHGSSTPPGNIGTLNEDAVAAYAAFVRKFPTSWRRCVLGHSMGNAPMLHAFPSFAPRPDCVVMANAFSSVEDFARASGAPSAVTLLLHGVWDNTEAIKAVNAPLMLVHSDADETIPPFMAKRLDKAVPGGVIHPEIIAQLHGFGHDALYEDPTLAWWGPVLLFLRGS